MYSFLFHCFISSLVYSIYGSIIFFKGLHFYGASHCVFLIWFYKLFYWICLITMFFGLVCQFVSFCSYSGTSLHKQIQFYIVHVGVFHYMTGVCFSFQVFPILLTVNEKCSWLLHYCEHADVSAPRVGLQFKFDNDFFFHSFLYCQLLYLWHLFFWHNISLVFTLDYFSYKFTSIHWGKDFIW